MSTIIKEEGIKTDFLEKVKAESRRVLKRELEEIGADTSIPGIIKYLEKVSRVGHPGQCGTHADNVNKEALRLASVYLQDYLDYMESIDVQET